MSEVKFTPPDADSRKHKNPVDNLASDGLTTKVDNKNLAYGHENGLCFTCRHHWHYRRANKNQYVLLCNAGMEAVRVEEDIMECSSYSNPLVMSLREMGELATLIDVRPTGGHYV